MLETATQKSLKSNKHFHFLITLLQRPHLQTTTDFKDVKRVLQWLAHQNAHGLMKNKIESNRPEKILLIVIVLTNLDDPVACGRMGCSPFH